MLFECGVQSACRKVPLRPQHFQFAACVFVFCSEIFIAEQHATCFGAISSVWSWHRISNWLCCFMRCKFHLVLLEHVDDFFGIQRKGVRTRACDVLAVVFSAFFFVVLVTPNPERTTATEVSLTKARLNHHPGGKRFQALRRCLTGFAAPPRDCASVRRFGWRCRGSATPGVPRARGSRAAAPPVSSPLGRRLLGLRAECWHKGLKGCALPEFASRTTFRCPANTIRGKR